MRWHLLQGWETLVIELLLAADLVEFDDFDVLGVLKICDRKIIERNMSLMPIPRQTISIRASRYWLFLFAEDIGLN